MEERLKKLERMNRILCLGLVLALVPWVVGAAKAIPDLIEGAKGKFKTIEAKQVVLVDDTGKKVGMLVGEKRGCSLTVQDGKGIDRLLIGMYKGHPSLLFANKSGNIISSYAEKNGNFEISQ